jgi:hypothetical protein
MFVPGNYRAFEARMLLRLAARLNQSSLSFDLQFDRGLAFVRREFTDAATVNPTSPASARSR